MGRAPPGAGAGSGGHEVDSTELDALHAQDILAHAVDLAHLAAKDDDLQAIVVVQVDVQRGDRLQEVRVLDRDQLLRQVGGVVVVDDEDRRDGLCPRVGNALLAQLLADQVANRLRAALIPLPGNQLVEVGQQVLVQ